MCARADPSAGALQREISRIQMRATAEQRIFSKRSEALVQNQIVRLTLPVIYAVSPVISTVQAGIRQQNQAHRRPCLYFPCCLQGVPEPNPKVTKRSEPKPSWKNEAKPIRPLQIVVIYNEKHGDWKSN
jgi:hypothetical protein